jgi:hypothetical protein
LQIGSLPRANRFAPGIAFENFQLSCRRYRFVPVVLDVKFGRFACVMRCMLVMPVRGVRVVGR